MRSTGGGGSFRHLAILVLLAARGRRLLSSAALRGWLVLVVAYGLCGLQGRVFQVAPSLEILLVFGRSLRRFVFTLWPRV